MSEAAAPPTPRSQPPTPGELAPADTPPEPKKSFLERVKSWTWKTWLKLGIFVLVIVGIVVAASVAGNSLGPALLDALESIREQGFLGIVLFFLLYVVITVSLLPASLLTISAGFIWGILIAIPLVVVSATVGALAAMFAGRYLLQSRIHKRLDRDYPDWRYIDRSIAQDNGLKIMLLLRLSPIIPFNLLNWGLGTTTVSVFNYVLGTFLGIIPGVALYTYIGTTISDIAEERPRDPLETVFFIVGGLVTVVTVVYTIIIAKKGLKAAVDEAKKNSEADDKAKTDSATPRSNADTDLEKAEPPTAPKPDSGEA